MTEKCSSSSGDLIDSKFIHHELNELIELKSFNQIISIKFEWNQIY